MFNDLRAFFSYNNDPSLHTNHAISNSLMFPDEFAATRVFDCPRQHTLEINWLASSTSRPERGSMLLNLKDKTGIGKAL